MVKSYIHNIYVINIYIILEMLILIPWDTSGGSAGNFTLIIHDTKFPISRHDQFPNSKKLKCKLSNDEKRVYEITWEYKQCGIGLDLIPCTEAENIPWKPFMCTNHKNQTKPCDKSSLTLRNLTKDKSGLYMCINRNYMSREFIGSKLFLVHVIDEKAEKEVRVVNEEPEMDNQIKNINDTALFRCRVRSLYPVTIKWLRSATERSNINKMIKDPIQSLEFVDSDRAIKVSRDTWISKLKIPLCQTSHSGYYFCVVVPLHNGSITSDNFVKSFSLTVLSPSTTSDLWVLILIAVILLFIAPFACFLIFKYWRSLKQHEIHYERG